VSSLRFAIVALFLAVLASVAFAGTLEAPRLREGQFVYRIPADFIPDKLSVQGLQEIQRTAAGLHYPFYVVFVQSLPTETGESTDDDTERAIVGLAEDWARDPNFVRNRSTIYLVSYGPGPRKYKMLPAPLWRSELGLENDALKPYNEIFKSTARRDPQSALTKLMSAFDADVYEGFDPKRKAEKAEAARKQREAAELAAKRRRAALLVAEQQRAEAARLADARAFLEREIVRMRKAVREEAEFMPANAATYETRLEKAQAVRLGSDPTLISATANDLAQASAVIEQVVFVKQSERRSQALKKWGMIVGGVLLAIFYMLVVVGRWALFESDKEKLKTRVDTWRGWIQQARQRYYLFDENRERAPHLRKYVGKTRELYESASREIDSIIVGVEAMSTLLDSAEAMAKSATRGNRKPLTEALAMLDKPFTYATDQISDKLFEPMAKTVELTPGAFFENLSERYDAAVKNWQALNESVTRSLEDPDKLFPHTGLDALLARAREHGIPDRWLSKHPLIGDDAEDQRLYASISQNRLTDPYAYSLEIENLRQREADLAAIVERLVAALDLAKSHRVDTVTGLADTLLDPAEDPKVTLDAANEELAHLAQLVATSDSIDAVEAQAGKVDGLYRRCEEQIAAAKKAILTASGVVDQVASAAGQCQALEQTVSLRLARAALEHTDISAARGAHDAGLVSLQAGVQSQKEAQAKLQERKHSAALREAEKALAQFPLATSKFTAALDRCAELDEAKARYERELAEMTAIQQQAMSRIQRYNGSPTVIAPFQSPVMAGGPVDYIYMYALLEQQKQHWNAVVSQAEQAYEQQQRALRDAEDAARRARDAASSSSSSIWTSSSDSGSSGGSWSSSSDSSSSSSSSSSGSDGGSW
jgi:hypothetical protein